MFDKKDVSAYQKITAPESLKHKVLTSEKEYNRTKKSSALLRYKPVYFAAACMALIIGISSFGSWSKSSISVYTSDKTVASASLDSRNVTVSGIPVEVETNHSRTVTVSQGSLTEINENGEIVNFGTEVKVKGFKELSWEIDAQSGEEYQMDITGWGQDKTYQLVYEQVTDTWKLEER